MSLADDVDLEEFVQAKDELSGADIKAVCTEAGLLALRERRMRVTMADLRAAREKTMFAKKDNGPEGLCTFVSSVGGHLSLRSSRIAADFLSSCCRPLKLLMSLASCCCCNRSNALSPPLMKEVRLCSTGLQSIACVPASTVHSEACDPVVTEPGFMRAQTSIGL